jgi:hypothetical protein
VQLTEHKLAASEWTFYGSWPQLLSLTHPYHERAVHSFSAPLLVWSWLVSWGATRYSRIWTSLQGSPQHLSKTCICRQTQWGPGRIVVVGWSFLFSPRIVADSILFPRQEFGIWIGHSSILSINLLATS